MTERRIDLTRRKVLGAVGGIGVAGAGAGMGTSALFSDTESFEENTITAGELDLKVDWEEHYSYPQIYGFDDPTSGLTVTRTEPTNTTDYVGLPDPESPVVWVHEDDLGAYMANTAIEAFPDPDNDGAQEVDTSGFTYLPCEDGADLPDHLTPSPSGSGATRTDNADTMTDGNREPLINLTDVKPGDFGEFTLSFHLCDNPGYLWLEAANVDQSGGANPEPEQDAEGDANNDPNLAENIQTVWWYDDGDNVLEEEIGKVDVMLAVDTSASLTSGNVSDLESDANQLATDLVNAGDAQVGGLTFGDSSIGNFSGLSASPGTLFSGLSPNGNTPTPAALEIAAAELDANARPGAETFIVLFTDGGPNYPNQTYSAGGYTVGSGYTGGISGNSTVDDSELEETATIADGIRSDHRILTVGINDDRKPSGRESDPAGSIFGTGSNGYLSSYLQNEIAGGMADYFSAEDAGAVSNILNSILETIATSEEVFRRGTLESDLNALSTPVPLDGDLTTAFDEFSDPDTSPDRECFQPGVTHYIGFGWWVPDSVGNEIQGDSVSFDLGFYTQQCRNNDGAYSGP
ncbi:vWA domain-containing protein [Natronomonas marina]|uniref:vWA domain-containing protein n=1 Tax=Natronomonas marina TaxID=2961939 RepID=UPI0020C986F7|nr:vWA domain-containing protein [Natronomonas marina]